jgi:hypothetical protein
MAQEASLDKFQPSFHSADDKEIFHDWQENKHDSALGKYYRFNWRLVN